MLKRSLMMSVAALVLLAPALAQTPTPPASSTQAPAATPSATTSAPENAKPGFIAEQGKDQWLASKNLIGAKVGGPNNVTVGSVNDLLMEKNGNVIAAVIGVGGFLGIGSKNVAVPFKSLELSRDTDGNDKIAMRFSKEELQQAPDFKPLAPPQLKPPVAGGGGAMPGGKTQ
jgi:PRC-barrel domain